MQDGFNLKEWETAAKRFCNKKLTKFLIIFS